MVFTKKDYLQLDRTWKAKPVAFKAHPENKATVQEIQRQQNFKTEGETLDFILQHYLHTTKATPATENQPTEPQPLTTNEVLEKIKEEGIETILIENENSHSKGFSEGFDAAFATPNINQLTNELNKWFPEYFAPVIKNQKLKEVTPQQAVNLAVAYALEDKKEGFPYDHHSRPLLDELLISDSE